jgi:hypothetical protein
MERWKMYKGKDKLIQPQLGCECSKHNNNHNKDGRDDDRKDDHHMMHHDTDVCSVMNTQHVWPAHDENQLYSTRVDTMFTSDHYALITDLFFLK